MSFKINLTWNEFIYCLSKGLCPINNWPDYDFMIKSFKEKCNMRLIESENFKTVYNDSINYIEDVVNNETKGNKLGNISFSEKVYKFYTDETDENKIYKDISFLYRYYVFKKDEGNLKEVKDKYFGKKSTIYTRK